MLRKKTACLLAITTLMIPSYARSQSQAEYDTIKKTLNGLKIDTIRFIEGLDMYEVVADNQAAYLTKDMRYFFVGRVFDLRTKRDLTGERIASLRRVDFKSLNPKNAIKMGNGSKSLAVFTDPNCGYCRKLHGELTRIKDVSVHIYLYPLAAQNEEAQKKAASILCAGDPLAALNKTWFAKEPFKPEGEPSKACMASIADNIRVGRSHRISSTPTMILESGKVVVGYKSEKDVRAMIEAEEIAR